MDKLLGDLNMVIAKFEYKGNEYTYNGVCKIKVDDSWIDAVIYSRDGHTYVRELLDFFLNFTCVKAKNPMPGEMWLKKDKTIADIIGDQLGPGYVPGSEADKTHIPAEEVKVEQYKLSPKLNKNVSKFA